MSKEFPTVIPVVNVDGSLSNTIVTLRQQPLKPEPRILELVQTATGQETLLREVENHSAGITSAEDAQVVWPKLHPYFMAAVNHQAHLGLVLANKPNNIFGLQYLLGNDRSLTTLSTNANYAGLFRQGVELSANSLVMHIRDIITEHPTLSQLITTTDNIRHRQNSVFKMYALKDRWQHGSQTAITRLPEIHRGTQAIYPDLGIGELTEEVQFLLMARAVNIGLRVASLNKSQMGAYFYHAETEPLLRVHSHPARPTRVSSIMPNYPSSASVRIPHNRLNVSFVTGEYVPGKAIQAPTQGCPITAAGNAKLFRELVQNTLGIPTKR